MTDTAHHYAGFDASGYPGDAFMVWAKQHTNLAWCGFYLTAPSHGDAGWMGKRNALAAQGWGLAPVFVGQQIEGPGSHVETAAQGRVDGAITCERMATATFPARSYVYLDLENGPPETDAEDAYVIAWAEGVRGGGYAPGVYCSHLLAPRIAAAVPDARVWCFAVPTVASTPIYGATFPALDPAGCGYPDAALWQHRQNVAWHNTSRIHPLITVDLDTAAMADPSAPA